MPIALIRSGLVAAFAVMFGILQIICPCLPDVQSANLVTSPPPVAHHMSGQDMAAHSGHDLPVRSAPAHDHGEHDHQADCAHCDGAVVLGVSADIGPSELTSPIVIKALHTNPVSTYRADMAGTNLAALRCLDPPRPLPIQTPVSLHTRSLI